VSPSTLSTMAEKNEVPGASVTSRALSVLAAFEDAPGSLSVSRIAQKAGLPLSTTYRLVGELEEWGGLRKGSDGKYQIGFRIWELGQLAGRRLRDRAHPFLQDLFDLTRENVHLAIREGTQSLYVDKLYGSRKMPVVSRVGGRLPLHATAVGRIMLAAQPQWFIDAYLEGDLEKPTPNTVTNPVILRQLIAEINEQGYAVTIEQMRPGALSVAVPIVFNETTVASVGLVFESNRYREVSRFLPMLTGTAHRIEGAMVGLSARMLL
jgi:DNA-binding IclR family transcriptional regulator